MNNHCPSDLIPVQNNMIISFVNYELRVQLEDKSAADIERETVNQNENFAQWDEEWKRMAGAHANAPIATEEPKPVVEEAKVAEPVAVV